MAFLEPRWGVSWPDVQKAVAALGAQMPGGSRKSIIAMAPGDKGQVQRKLTAATYTFFDSTAMTQTHMKLAKKVFDAMVTLPFGLKVVEPVGWQGAAELKRIREMDSEYRYVTEGSDGAKGGCTDPAYFRDVLVQHVPDLLLLDDAPEWRLIEFYGSPDDPLTFDQAAGDVHTLVAALGLPHGEVAEERFGSLPDGAPTVPIAHLSLACRPLVAYVRACVGGCVR